MKKLLVLPMLFYTLSLSADYQSNSYSTNYGPMQRHGQPDMHIAYWPNSSQSSGYYNNQQGYGPSQGYYSEGYYAQPQGYNQGYGYNQPHDYYNQPNYNQSQSAYAPAQGHYYQSDYNQQANGYNNVSSDRIYNDNRNEKADLSYAQKYANDTYATNADREINAKIRKKFSGWVTVSYKYVVLHTDNGNVFVEGIVETPDDRNKLTDEIRNVEGVRSVNNNTQIKKQLEDSSAAIQANNGYSDRTFNNNRNEKADLSYAEKYPNDTYATNTDREINAKARKKFSGWITDSYKYIVLRTANGNVFIEGIVETPNDRNKLTDAIRSIEGVQSVNNNVQVTKQLQDTYAPTQGNYQQDYNQQSNGFNGKTAYNDNPNEKVDLSYADKFPSDTYTTNADHEINAKIRKKFSGWIMDNYKFIVLHTDNGIVIVQGVVDNPGDRNKLSAEISSIKGVRFVNNNAQVKK